MAKTPSTRKSKILYVSSKGKEKNINNSPEKDANVVDDEDEKIKLLKRSVVVNSTQMNECKEILRSIGLPVIEAEEEADSQCAYLSKKNLVYGIASEDMDLLTFGTKKLIRNFSISKNKQMLEISLDKILEDFEMTMDQFIDLCILLGCDYSSTIKGIGTKKAFSFIKKYKSIEGVISFINESKTKRYKVPENFRYKEAREYFKRCVSCNVERKELQWNNPDIEKFKELLESYEFSEKKISKQIKRVKNYNDLYNKRRKKILEQRAGKRMMSKLYKIKDENKSSKNDSFKIGLVRDL